MSNSLIKRKKKVNLLWALTAIPIVVAGTVAASCGSVMNNIQDESDDVNNDEVASIDWQNLKTNDLGKKVSAKDVKISDNSYPALVKCVEWDNSIDATKIEVESIFNTNNEAGSLEAEIVYGNRKIHIKVYGFKKVAEETVPQEGWEKNFDLLVKNFSEKIYVNESAKHINANYVTTANIDQYIDVFKGIDHSTGLLQWNDARITVLNIRGGDSSSKVLVIDVLISAYGKSAQYSFKCGGFLSEKEYLEEKLKEYVDHWSYKVTDANRVKMSDMYSPKLYTEELFRKYIDVSVESEYVIKFDSITWPSTSSIQAVVLIGVKDWNTITPIQKVIRYDGFKETGAKLQGLVLSQYQFTDPLIFTKNISWYDWNKKVPNWDSLQSKDYMESALMDAAKKTYRNYALEFAVKSEMTRIFGLQASKWIVKVELPNNWYDRVKKLTNWDKEFYDEGRTGFGGISDWAHPQARLKRTGWQPEFLIKVSSGSLPGFEFKQSFWLVGTK